MFAGLKRAAGAKCGRGLVLLKSAPKSENKTYNHFTRIKGQSNPLAFARCRQTDYILVFQLVEIIEQRS
jgi:hypothetical protein